jgi:hypothetical protein
VLDRIGCARSHCVTALGIPRCRHEAMAARATRETRSTWSALDLYSCARSHRCSIAASRVRAQARSACAIADVVRSSAPTGASHIKAQFFPLSHVFTTWTYSTTKH